MKKEYLVIKSENNEISERLRQLGVYCNEIKSKYSYYLAEAPAEKLKDLQTAGLEIIARFSEIPDSFSEFKNKFKLTINELLEKDNLPSMDSIVGYRPLCSAGSPYTNLDFVERDRFLDRIFNGFKKLKTVKS